MNNLIEELEAARGKLGWTRQEISTHLGISIATYGRWLKEENTPSKLARRAIQIFLDSLQEDQEIDKLD